MNAEREALVLVRDLTLPGEGERHICSLDNSQVALCGFPRTRPLLPGDPATASCVVCLDLYAQEQLDG